MKLAMINNIRARQHLVYSKLIAQDVSQLTVAARFVNMSSIKLII